MHAQVGLPAAVTIDNWSGIRGTGNRRTVNQRSGNRRTGIRQTGGPLLANPHNFPNNVWFCQPPILSWEKGLPSIWLRICFFPSVTIPLLFLHLILHLFCTLIFFLIVFFNLSFPIPLPYLNFTCSGGWSKRQFLKIFGESTFGEPTFGETTFGELTGHR